MTIIQKFVRISKFRPIRERHFVRGLTLIDVRSRLSVSEVEAIELVSK